MIIWSGFGLLTVVPGVLVAGLVGFAADLASQAAGMPTHDLACVADGRRVVLRRRHRLFLIAMQWWSLALPALAAILLVAPVKPGPDAVPPRSDSLKPSKN